jgi:hypothetical protein
MEQKLVVWPSPAGPQHVCLAKNAVPKDETGQPLAAPPARAPAHVRGSPCYFFQRGFCSFGDDCKFVHVSGPTHASSYVPRSSPSGGGSGSGSREGPITVDDLVELLTAWWLDGNHEPTLAHVGAELKHHFPSAYR